MSLSHDCGNGGAVEYQLTGDPNAYDYYWLHGQEELFLDGLSPGNYTLVVTDFFGCVENYDVEILSLTSCTVTHQVSATLDPCYSFIQITVTSQPSGNPIDESLLNITWGDGYTGGLTRTVYNGSIGVYCATISIGDGAGGYCCIKKECINISLNPNCYGCDKKLLINEKNQNPLLSY